MSLAESDGRTQAGINLKVEVKKILPLMQTFLARRQERAGTDKTRRGRFSHTARF